MDYLKVQADNPWRGSSEIKTVTPADSMKMRHETTKVDALQGILLAELMFSLHVVFFLLIYVFFFCIVVHWK